MDIALSNINSGVNLISLNSGLRICEVMCDKIGNRREGRFSNTGQS